MTLVIGYITRDKIYMAADNIAKADNFKFPVATDKIVVSNFGKEDIIIGLRGSFGGNNIIKKIFPIKHKGIPKQNAEWIMLNRILPDIRKEFDQEEVSNFEILIGFRGKLFCIYSSFSMVEIQDDFHAIGSGRNYALPMLNDLYTIPFANTEDILKRTIESVSKYCASVNNHITIRYINK